MSSAKDLIFTGRTLFGRSAAQGPGAGRPLLRRTSRPRVLRLHEGSGRRAVEAGGSRQAPSTTRLLPHSMSWLPFSTPANMAVDHNQLTMEMMKKVAERHGLVCLLHEKPFDGVNGSGKHNNWSLSAGNG